MERVSVMALKDFKKVRDFYWELIDQMQGSPNLPGWEKGLYPSDDYLRQSLENEELYVLSHDDEYVAAMVLNHECNDGYSGTEWKIDVDKNQVLIIHTLGVIPTSQRKGIARYMLEEAIRIAKDRNQSAIRLDVLHGNIPAMKLYESMGFEHRRTTQMFYEDTGWTEYLLYELVL